MKKTIKLILCLLIIISVSNNVNAQSKNFENVKEFSKKGIVPIHDKGVLKGYYINYFIENTNKKNKRNVIEVLDANIQTTQNISVDISQSTYVVGVSYNNNHFCFLLYDTESTELTVQIYNLEGNNTGGFKVKELGIMTTALFTYGISTNFEGVSILHNIGNGFCLGYDMKGAYRVVRFDSFGKIIWDNIGKAKSGKGALVTLRIVNTEDNFICIYEEKASMFSKVNVEESVKVIDKETGEDLESINISSDGKYNLIHGGDIVNDEIVLYGEAFKAKKGKVIFTEKTGITLESIDENGKKIIEKSHSWESIVKSIAQKNNLKSDLNLSLLKVAKLSNGTFYVISELIEVKGVNLEVKEFLITELNKDFDIVKADLINVKSTKQILPPEYRNSVEFVSLLNKNKGWSKYDFTSFNSSKDNFNTVYSYKEKSEYQIGIITLENGNLINKEFPFKSDATFVSLVPSKPGYIGVVEFFKKEEKASIKLIKMDI